MKSCRLDMRGGMSEVSGGAINFNAVFAIPAFAAGLGPSFFKDVNEHEFIFSNNVPGENEQETTEFSIKADWDRDGVDVTAILSYSDLEEYLLSDGTSATFYGYELTDACQADRATLNNAPTSMGGADRSDLFGDFFGPFGVFPGKAGLIPTLPVSMAPIRPQPVMVISIRSAISQIPAWKSA